MTGLEAMIVFTVGIIGFFAAIGGMVAWLTRVEQNLPYIPRLEQVSMSDLQEDVAGTLVPEPALGE